MVAQPACPPQRSQKTQKILNTTLHIILSDNINTTILNTSLAFFPLQKRPTVTLTEAYVIHDTPSNNYRTNAATQQMPLTVSANNPTQSQSYS